MNRGLWLGVLSLLAAAIGAVEPAEQKVRPAAVAGTWYPGDAGELATYLDGLLSKAKAPDDGDGRVRALISPHAGYAYSGAAAADGYGLLRGAEYERVIVLGPAHRGWFRGLSIADVGHYETPLGRIPLDQEGVAVLRTSDLVTADPFAHDGEHSIEMQLPLLQRVLQPGWKLLPVLVGSMEEGDYERAAGLLRPLLDQRTLLVVSSDFTHYGPRFGYIPFPHDGQTAARIEELDRGALQRILARDPGGFLAHQNETGITVCGFRPIAIALRMLPEGVEGALRTYATSGELTGDYRHSVSYLSIVFRDQGPPPPTAEEEGGISPENMELLHDLAVGAVELAARNGDGAAIERLNRLLEQVPSELESRSGAFVTLKKNGELRGCVGYIQPRKPLYRAVAENGVNAAARDRRFAPLRPEELDGLEVEVSVLSPPEPIASYREFRVGEQGIILEKGGRSAVFLPEVALEQGWNREQTLNRLAQKAGLPEEAWKEGAVLKVFRSQKFSAPYSGQDE